MSTTSSRCKPLITPALKEFEECLRTPVRHDTKSFFHCQLEGLEAIDSLTRKGLRVIGKGGYRTVFELSPKCVMKVPYDYTSARANVNELHAWKKIRLTKDKRVIQLFAPVSHASKTGAYLVMPKVQMYSDEKKDLIGQSISRMRTLGVGCTDLHYDNWGILKNSAVIIDYGFGIECKIRPGISFG